ncbi:MFS sugar transporter [Colletotrichum karsti]|uniref:MFS sugar transporter n=1 Tax=Colletotrichum karsti TaxID=1095194 RepID=A0A9P6HYL4_9PEZI|nr:MFS sugar transporter [Colletotrichum karsti]KAF9872814.1 MFS sugar transporter [Colletotrichum karsti]
MSTKHVGDVDSHEVSQIAEEIERAQIDPLSSLDGLSKEALHAYADNFVDSSGLDEARAFFHKAAIIAQNPQSYETLVDINTLERQALVQEQKKKWNHPWSLWFTIATCSVGAAVHGWDQTGSNGANLSFPQEFGIGSNSAHDKWILGLVNSAPTIAIFVIRCWLSDPLNNILGRRGTIFVSGIFSFASVLGSGFTQTWQQLLLWVAVGIFLGFTANLVVMNAGAITWRLQIGSAMIPAVPLICMIYLCPESPRWYMKMNRPADAFASLQRLRFTKLQAARDLLLMHVALEAEKSLFAHRGSALKRFQELFTIPRVRRANLAAATVMLAQQMCGINIISFYSSSIFVESGFSEQRALWASWGFGLVNFTFAIPALWLIDSYGRRTLLLTTFPHMAWTLLAAGFCFLIGGDGTARLALIALFIFSFTAFYSIGLGPVCFVYAAEVFPLSHRELGMAWSVVINAVGASILGLTFPYMLSALTPTGAFGFYCGLNMLALFVIFGFLPETKQLTLEELDVVFAVRSWTFIRYQFTVVIPYWYRRWILWQREVVLEPISHRSSSQDM